MRSADGSLVLGIAEADGESSRTVLSGSSGCEDDKEAAEAPSAWKPRFNRQFGHMPLEELRGRGLPHSGQMLIDIVTQTKESRAKLPGARAVTSNYPDNWISQLASDVVKRVLTLSTKENEHKGYRSSPMDFYRPTTAIKCLNSASTAPGLLTVRAISSRSSLP